MAKARTKRSVSIVAGFLVALAFLQVAGPVSAQLVPAGAEIRTLSGRVEILRKGRAQWGPATVGMKLQDGDEIRSSGGASAELVLPDASTVLLAENSRLGVVKLATTAQGQSRVALFHLAVGKVRASVAQASIALVRARQVNFAVSTPTGVSAVRGTVKVVAYDPATRTTSVAVLSGSALFADNATRTPVTVGVNAVATQTGSAPPVSPVPISLASPAVRAATAPTATNPATANHPALVAPPAPVTTPQVMTVVVTAAVKTAPGEAAQVTAGAVTAAPEAAAAITTAAVTAAPAQAAQITTAAVTAAPAQAAQITTAAVTATPAAAPQIAAAAAQAAPEQAAAIAVAATQVAPAQGTAIAQSVVAAAPAQATAVQQATGVVVTVAAPVVTTIFTGTPTTTTTTTIGQDTKASQ